MGARYGFTLLVHASPEERRKCTAVPTTAQATLSIKSCIEASLSVVGALIVITPNAMKTEAISNHDPTQGQMSVANSRRKDSTFHCRSWLSDIFSIYLLIGRMGLFIERVVKPIAAPGQRGPGLNA